MTSIARRPLGAIFLSAAAALAISMPNLAQAQEGPGLVAKTLGQGHWRMAVSPFSHHFRKSDEHRAVWAVGAEWQRSDDWLAGASYFSNSFGQPSAYVYLGKRWPKLFGHEQLFAQASGGMLYGYRGKYEDKVPLNNNGFSPGALVGLGWQFNKNIAITGHMLGDAGVMFQLSCDFR